MSSLKLLYTYSKGLRKTFLAALIFILAETSFEVIIPLLMSDMIDVGILQRESGIFLQKGIQMMICAVLSLVFGLLYARCASRAITLYARKLRSVQFEKIQNYAFSNLDRFEVSSLITRMTGDVNVIQNALVNGIRPFARGPIILILGLLMSFLINPELSVIFLITTPILGVVLFCIVSRVSPMYARLQQALDTINLRIQENLRAIKTVKAFVRDRYEEDRFDNANELWASLTRHTFHIATLNTPSFQLTMYTAIVGLMLTGISMIHQGTLQVGELTGVLSYVLQITNSLMMISNVFLLLSRSIASCHRVAEVINEPVALVSKEMVQEPDGASVDFDHVFFKYNENAEEYVLQDINVHIPEGYSVGILGATGSAKSTLVQLIDRLYDVSAGSIKIGGTDVRDMDLNTLRRMVSIVLQHNTLFSGTVKENLLWGNPEASDEEIKKVCQSVCAEEFIVQMPQGYDSHIEQGGANLSGGQRQRLCIARALLKRPDILILDDSTSAVDTQTEFSIQRTLTDLDRMTKIIIAQRIRSVQHCDLILILEDGTIADSGTHETLMETSSFYRSLVVSQQKGGEE